MSCFFLQRDQVKVIKVHSAHLNAGILILKKKIPQQEARYVQFVKKPIGEDLPHAVHRVDMSIE